MSKSDDLGRVLEKAARWYVRRKVGDERQVQERVKKARDKHDGDIIDALAERNARIAAARGFVTGLASSPWTSIPLALLNVDGATSREAKLAASAGLIADPSFFARPEWDRQVLEAMLDLPGPQGGAGALPKQIAKRIVIERAKKMAVRSAANAVPFLGAALGAAVEYVSVKRVAKRVRERFPQVNDERANERRAQSIAT